jgi:hypothetical protein
LMVEQAPRASSSDPQLVSSAPLLSSPVLVQDLLLAAPVANPSNRDAEDNAVLPMLLRRPRLQSMVVVSGQICFSQTADAAPHGHGLAADSPKPVQDQAPPAQDQGPQWEVAGSRRWHRHQRQAIQAGCQLPARPHRRNIPLGATPSRPNLLVSASNVSPLTTVSSNVVIQSSAAFARPAVRNCAQKKVKPPVPTPPPASPESPSSAPPPPVSAWVQPPGPQASRPRLTRRGHNCWA